MTDCAKFRASMTDYRAGPIAPSPIHRKPGLRDTSPIHRKPGLRDTSPIRCNPGL